MTDSEREAERNQEMDELRRRVNELWDWVSRLSEEQARMETAKDVR